MLTQFDIYYDTNNFSKSRVKTHPRMTKHGATIVQEYERIEPKTIAEDLSLRKDVRDVLGKLHDILEQFAPTNYQLVERSVKHYFGNFLVPIMLYQERKQAGQISEDEYEEFIQSKQVEFQDLFGKVKEAIKMERIRPYMVGEPYYEIKKSRKWCYGN